MMRPAAAAACLLWFAWNSAAAQNVECGNDRICKVYQGKLSDALGKVRSAPDDATKQRALQELLDVSSNHDLFSQALAIYLQETQAAAFITEEEKKLADLNTLSAAYDQLRIDKQTSAPSSANGSTSLVSLPSGTSLVSFAVQSGALTQSVNGETANLRANMYGLWAKLDGLDPNCDGGCKGFSKFANNVELAASMNLAAAASQSVMTAGSATTTAIPVTTVQVPASSMRLSSVTARYVIYNPSDPRSKAFHDAFLGTTGQQGLYQQHQSDYSKAAQDLQAKLLALLSGKFVQDATTLMAQVNDQISKDLGIGQAANTTALGNDYATYFRKNAALLASDDPNFTSDLGALQASITSYRQLNQDVVNLAKGVPEWTVEYIYSKPVGQPQTHDARLIYAYTPGKLGGLLAGGTFTLNAAASVYGEGVPATAKYGRLRDIQVAAEWDRPLGNLANKKAVFSLAGYGQYQPDPTVLNITAGNLAPGTGITLPADAQVLLGTAGWQGIGQVKITITTNSGATIPLAFKWANKTDLLDSTNKLNGQFGISYDFSSFSQLFGSSAAK